MQSSNFRGARDNFTEAISLDPRAAEAYAQMGEAYFQEDDSNQINIREAVEYANKAVNYDDSLWIPHNTLGKIYVQTRNWNEAIKEFKEASRLNPEDANILYELGKVQYRAGQFNDAKISFEGVTHLDPGFSKAYYNLGVVYNKLGNARSALDAYKKAINTRSIL